MDEITLKIEGLDRIAKALEDMAEGLYHVGNCIKPEYQTDLAIGKPLLEIAKAIREQV